MAKHNLVHGDSSRGDFERYQNLGIWITLSGPLVLAAFILALSVTPLANGIVLEPMTAEQAGLAVNANSSVDAAPAADWTDTP